MQDVITPRAQNYAMPAEWAPHDGCWMIWPERPDNWRLGAKPAQAAFAAVAGAIARFEPVTMLVSARQFANARAMLPDAVRVVEASSNDAWARDTGATFLLDPAGEPRRGGLGVQCLGRAWRRAVFPVDLDDQIAAKMLEIEKAKRFRAPKVLEGGAIHVDGQGTVLVTESCLLDENRNPGATRAEMEALLRDYLGVEKIVWLGAGVPHDETGGHVDNLACFVRPGIVLLSWCDDPNDLHYQISRDAEARLLAAGLTVEHIPMPTPLYLTEAEAAGIDHAANGMNRAAGERLAASYVNFYAANGAIVAPCFGVPTDEPARAVLQRLFPDRQIVMVPAREILLGGGNIHCITQQQPKRSSPE